MLLGGKELLTHELLLERAERLDAVGAEERLEVGALRRLLAGGLRTLLLEAVRERHLGNVVEGNVGGPSGMFERNYRHSSVVEWVGLHSARACKAGAWVVVLLGQRKNESSVVRRVAA